MMAMEINGLNNNQTNSSKAKSSQSTGAPASTGNVNEKADSAPSSDSVQISAEAKMLNKLSNELGADSPVNQEKVEALRAAISDGSYKPNPQAIAQKMLDSDDLF